LPDHGTLWAGKGIEMGTATGQIREGVSAMPGPEHSRGHV